MTDGGRRPWIPFGLAGAAALVLAIEGFFIGNTRRFATDQSWRWRDVGGRAVRETRGRQVVCFGDSLVEFGIFPRVLKTFAGVDAYNLALHNGQPAASYFLLRRVLDAPGPGPSAVIVDFLPAHLARDPRDPYFRRDWSELLDAREALDVAWTTRDVGWLSRTLLAKVLTSYKASARIRENLSAALEGKTWPMRHQLQLYERNWRQNQGAQVVPRRSWDPRKAATPSYGGVAARAWVPDAASGSYAERFLRLAADRGVRVYWLLPPITAASEARREHLDPSYTRHLEGMVRRFPNLVILDARRSDYPASCYVDPVHMHRDGASALSASVAEVLRDGPGRSRWVELPGYREPPAAVAVEDLGQSKEALWGRGRRRR